MNYRYRIYPDVTQEQRLLEWMDICRSAYNYPLRQIKDWCDSRKCLIDIGVDVGLEKFLATSEGVLVKPPKFFKSLQSKLQLLQRRLSRKKKMSRH